MIIGALMLGLLIFGLIAAVFCIPLWNKLFDQIWEDPTARQRREIRLRLNELCVDGHVPEEVALLMAAKEYNKTEEDLLRAAELLSVSDMKGMLTGQTSILGVFVHGIERAIKRGIKHNAK